MNLGKIVEQIKKTYSNREDLDEIVSDLSGDDNFFAYWADRFCEEDFSSNKELAKELFEIALERDETDLLDIASKICNSNGYNDKVWATDIFKLALEKAEDLSDKISICERIAQEDYLNDKEWATVIAKELENNIEDLSQYNKLISLVMYDIGDKKWAILLIKNALSKLLEADDMFEFACFGDEIITLGRYMADEDGANDKEAAKEIFDLIKQYDGVTYLLDGARAVMEIYGDDDYVELYTSDIVDRAIDFVEEGYYCDIYNFIKDELEDENKADEYKDNYYDEMQSDHEQYEGCEDLFGSSEDDVDMDIDFDNYDDKRSVIAVDTEAFIFSEIEEMCDEDGNLSDEGIELVIEKIEEFISEIKDKFEGNIEDTVLININGELKEFDPSLITNDIEEFESLYLYIVLTKDIPSDVINVLFLSLDNYGFYAMYQDDGRAIIQGYDCGEYNTGYFSSGRDEDYVDEFTNAGYPFGKFYKEAQKKLIDEQ